MEATRRSQQQLFLSTPCFNDWRPCVFIATEAAITLESTEERKRLPKSHEFCEPMPEGLLDGKGTRLLGE